MGLTGITIKVIVSQPTGVIANKSENKVKIYPNPVIDEALVEFTLSKGSNTYMQITAITGQVISKVNLDNLEAGNHIIPVDFKNHKSCIYLISIRTNEFTDNRKIYYRPGN